MLERRGHDRSVLPSFGSDDDDSFYYDNSEMMMRRMRMRGKTSEEGGTERRTGKKEKGTAQALSDALVENATAAAAS